MAGLKLVSTEEMVDRLQCAMAVRGDDDLIVSFRSEAGSITVDDWFADSATLDAIEMEEVRAYATDIERMVEAMVAFDAAETESELADAQLHLSNTLSESWHLKVS